MKLLPTTILFVGIGACPIEPAGDTCVVQVETLTGQCLCVADNGTIGGPCDGS